MHTTKQVGFTMLSEPKGCENGEDIPNGEGGLNADTLSMTEDRAFRKYVKR